MPRDLTCRELIEFLLEYAEGELAVDERAAFDAHLAICPDCVSYVEGYMATARAGKTAFADPDAAAPDDVPQDLIAAILDARRGS